MKKYCIVSLCTIMITTFSSCKKFLDTQSPSNFTEQVTFSNLDFAEKAVLGIYYNFSQNDLYGYSTSAFFPADNDIEHVSGADDANGRKTLCRYNATSGNSVTLRPWTLLYQSIERANVCIDNLPLSPIWNGTTGTQARRLYGEAKAIRAWCYYELIRNWGDVPFSVKSVRSGDNYYLPKTDRDEIYEFLIEDLKEAIEYVPWLSEVGTTERINKAFIKGLRARLALTYAGYSLRNETFETRRGRNWQQGYYQIARDECFQVMQSGKHKLNPSYGNIFRKMHSYGLDLEYGEIIFEVGTGRNYSGRIAEVIGMLHITNPLDTKYGRAIAEIQTHPYYFYSFDNADTRRNISVELYGYGDGNALGKQRLSAAGGMRISKWRRSWITPSMGGESSSILLTGVNWPLMRYADIVLMFAEAENELNDAPTADAINALSMIRSRAFPQSAFNDKVINYIASVSASKESFFEAIVNERAWEFGGEGIRKFDLVRWNLLGEKIAFAKSQNLKIINNDAAWQNVPNAIFWKENADGETIDILNQDYRETRTSISGYNRTVYLSGWSTSSKSTFTGTMDRWASGFNQSKNNHLFPIHNEVIASSNGSLKNDQMP